MIQSLEFLYFKERSGDSMQDTVWVLFLFYI